MPKAKKSKILNFQQKPATPTKPKPHLVLVPGDLYELLEADSKRSFRQPASRQLAWILSLRYFEGVVDDCPVRKKLSHDEYEQHIELMHRKPAKSGKAKKPKSAA